ncbi:MAG: hypothetical protein JST23_10530 [Bacteroidetes bacterium]|nr:hypothetical protein [Bacteroidota bacterium]
MAFIFAVYVMLLPALPCVDKGEANISSIENSLNTASHQEDQHSDEACSPFCNCNCCGQTIASAFHFSKQTSERVIISSYKTILYNSIILPSGHFGNIWQPPRIG